MNSMNELKNARVNKQRRRVGRGPGSGLGKTCGRGQKGQGARSGYKRRHGTEGGQLPFFKKLPTRGFSNVRFSKKLDVINLGQIEEIFGEGDTVSLESLREHGYISGKSHGLKVLGEGELNKKVAIEANSFSSGAQKQLEEKGIKFSTVSANS